MTENAFIEAAAQRPNTMPAEYNTAEDDVQRHFLGLFGSPVTSLAPVLARNLAQLRVAVPRVRTYTASGRVHTILAFPMFYTVRVNGVRLRDWLADLLRGARCPT